LQNPCSEISLNYHSKWFYLAVTGDFVVMQCMVCGKVVRTYTREHVHKHGCFPETAEQILRHALTEVTSA
jgi:hypothetical protein